MSIEKPYQFPKSQKDTEIKVINTVVGGKMLKTLLLVTSHLVWLLTYSYCVDWQWPLRPATSHNHISFVNTPELCKVSSVIEGPPIVFGKDMKLLQETI